MRDMVEGEVRLSTLANYESTIDKELEYIIGELQSISSYAVHVDITPPELEETNWSVARVFIPEPRPSVASVFPLQRPSPATSIRRSSESAPTSLTLRRFCS